MGHLQPSNVFFFFLKRRDFNVLKSQGGSLTRYGVRDLNHGWMETFFMQVSDSVPISFSHLSCCDSFEKYIRGSPVARSATPRTVHALIVFMRSDAAFCVELSVSLRCREAGSLTVYDKRMTQNPNCCCSGLQI